MKRLNRLTRHFSKKLADLEAAFAMFAAYYNYCRQTGMPRKRGKRRPTACVIAGSAGHVWSFDELFDNVLGKIMDSLTLFGLFAVSAMLICYALEDRSHWFVFAFAISCALGSTYGFLQGAWPFGLVEAIWAIVALRRWWSARPPATHL